MPQIREYTQQVGGASELPLGQVTRQAFASDFSGQGQGMVAAGQALQQVAQDGVAMQRMVQDQEARKEVTRAHVEIAQMNAEAAKELDRIQTSGEIDDENWVETFNARWSAQLDNIGTKYNTQAGQQTFERGSADMRAHYMVASAKVQSHVAGVRQVENYKQFVEASSNTLFIDPLQFERAEKNAIDTLNDPNGVFAGIPADKRAVLASATRETLAAAAVRGVIDKDPHVALANLQLGRWRQYFDADKTHALMVEAKVGINGLDAEARRQEAEAERKRKLEIKETQNQFVALVDSHKLTPQMVLRSNLEPVGEGSKEHYLNVIRAWAKEHKEKPITQDPGVFSDTLKAIRSGEITNETQIEELYAISADTGRGITWEDTKALRKEFDERRTPSGRILGDAMDAFIKKHSPSIDHSNPIMGKTDEIGRRKLGQFNEMVLRKMDEYRQAKKNPHDLFDESKPDYLGTDDILNGYRTGLVESIRAKADAVRSGAAPKTPPVGFMDKMKRTLGIEDPNAPLEVGNIDLDKRHVVKNKDGSVSTVRSMSFNIDGREVLLPTIAPDGSSMTPEEAIARYQETGEHLGVYKTSEAATEAAKKISKRQEKFATGDARAEQAAAVKGISESAQRASDFAASLPGASAPVVEPRRHGESAADYLKRREKERAK